MAYTKQEVIASYKEAIQFEGTAALASVIAGSVLALNASYGWNSFEKLSLADIRTLLRMEASEAKKSTQYKRAEQAILLGRAIMKEKNTLADIKNASCILDAHATVARWIEQRGISTLLELEEFLTGKPNKKAETSPSERIANLFKKHIEDMQGSDFSTIAAAIVEHGGLGKLESFALTINAKLNELREAQAIAVAAAEAKKKAEAAAAEAKKKAAAEAKKKAEAAAA